jgi:predicted nucleotidyltransferase
VRLDSKLVIGGQPAIKVRNFIRKVGDSPPWDINIPMKFLRLDAAEAGVLIEALEKEKLIKFVDRHGTEWIVTQKGHSLAAAKASLPIKRKTLEVTLQSFMERVREVNRDLFFLAKVTGVVLFGSSLRLDIERFGDVDLAVRLEPKEADPTILRQLNEQRAEE